MRRLAVRRENHDHHRVPVAGGLLHAERAEVPAARSTPAAALGALGLHVPVNVVDGTARVAVDKLAPERIAEIVYRVPVTVAGS